MSITNGTNGAGHTALPIPDGWFAVAWSKDLVPGDVRRARYFDQELVVFRTREGHVRVLDAYCPHLGAHLAEGGRVVGESIRCPFHGWRYDGTSGKCIEIPYAKHVPPAARVRSWDVCERNRMIFAWHHSAGEPPSWDVPLMTEIDNEDWTEPRMLDLEVPVHMQDMAENNCDPVHFLYVHGNTAIPPSDLSYEHEGRLMRMTSHHKKEDANGSYEFDLDRDTWGLGLAAVRMRGIGNAGLLMFSSTSPIDSGHTYSRWLFTVTKNLVDLAGEDFIVGLEKGVQEDMRIWRNKIHRANPVLCEGDTYLVEFRKWARQFYSLPAA